MSIKVKKFEDDLESPAKFSKTAAKHNVSVSSLEYIKENSEVKSIKAPFQDKVFDLNYGDVSSSIQGDDGYYVFKITGELKSKYSYKKFSKNREKLEENLKSIKFEQLFDDLMEKLKKDFKVKIFEENML